MGQPMERFTSMGKENLEENIRANVWKGLLDTENE
jgi:hypothetical protein